MACCSPPFLGEADSINMAITYADFLANVDETVKPVHDPSASPSWTLRSEHTLHYSSDSRGHVVQWKCNGATFLQHTDQHEIKTSTLFRFSDTTTDETNLALCTASSDVLTIISGTIYTISLSKLSTARITRLFSAHEGLILELSKSSGASYYFISHPLHELRPIPLPKSHEAIYITPDLPLFITRQGSRVHFWRTEISHETNFEIPEFMDLLEPNHAPEPQFEFGTPERRSAVSLALSEILVIDADPNAHVILAHDLRGFPVICVTANSYLTGFSLEMKDNRLERLVPSFKIRDVVTALPILSIRKPQNCLDILVKGASGQLSLYAGRNRLCTVDIDTMGDFRVLDAVGSKFTAWSDGDKFGRRYTLERSSFISPLVNDCLSAMSFVLEHSQDSRKLASLYQDLIESRSTMLQSSSSRSEWEQFQEAVLRLGADAYVSQEDRNAGPQHKSSWMFLISSKYHSKREKTRRLPPCPRSSIEGVHTPRSGLNRNNETQHQIFHALHLLYEDYKLDSHKQDMLRCLVSLPAKLAAKLGASAYLEHYRKDFPSLFPSLENDMHTPIRAVPPVPSIIQTIVDRIQGSTLVRPYPIPCGDRHDDDGECHEASATWRQNSPFELSQRVCSYFDILYSPSLRSKSRDQKSNMLLSRMTKDGFTKEDLACLPLGVCLPLRDSLSAGRVLSQLSVTMESLAILNREDMLETDFEPDSLPERKNQFPTEVMAMLRLSSSVSGTQSLAQPREVQRSSTAKNPDGFESSDSPQHHRFCDDRRIHEVGRILRSSEEIVISPNVAKPTEPSAEFDLASELKQKLEVLAAKRLAAPVGRGAFTLRTFVPSDPTQPLFIPQLCTTGRLLGQKGARVTWPTSDVEAALQWGKFHNGVAAGLRIVASTHGEQDVQSVLSRTWIVNHRPDDMAGSSDHAGMLLGCGLGGYLPALKKTDYYDYLQRRHELTSIGLMLGLSACNIGSMDEKITKMLCLHIRSFNVAGFAVPDFNVQSSTQTAAILGLGLLHRSSVEVGVLQGIMQELTFKPKPGDAIDNREALALAAGLSIGFVCIGRGSDINAAERDISDRLLALANGGRPKSRNRVGENGFSNAHEVNENGLDYDPPLADSEASRINEGGKSNTDVASPGALFALALIYMRTNDRRLMERIQIPNTLYSLDRTKPLHVFLAILTRALVMWDSISASEDWSAKSIPSLLHGIDQSGGLSPTNLLGRVNVPNGLQEEDIDVDGLMQARAFAIAGTLSAISLRYAGTCDSDAVAIIKKGCESYEKALRRESQSDVHMQWAYMTCLCSAALSLSIVAAGSGNLEILRILRRLRKLSTPTLSKKRYGFHLALHLAIGFLFLGGGCLTFGSNNEAVFGLLCATYPHFPSDVNDNQYHLQAFRHLYVLSVEPRCIETRDVDTGKPCSVDIKLKMKDGNMVGLRAPCIVPEASSIKELIIASERYMPRTVQINPPANGLGWFSRIKNQIVYVKRRVGHLPYETDPKGSRSIFARTLPHHFSGIRARLSEGFAENDLASLYGADPDIHSFDQFYCRAGLDSHEIVKKFKEALQECLIGDKTDALYHFVDIWRIAKLLERGCMDSVSAGSLRILNTYIGTDPASEKSLLRPSLIASVLRRANWSAECDVFEDEVTMYE